MQHAALCAALHQSTAAQEEATASRRESVAAMQAAKQAEALVEGLAVRVQVLEDYLQDAQIQKEAVAQEQDDALLQVAEQGQKWEASVPVTHSFKISVGGSMRTPADLATSRGGQVTPSCL